MTRIFIYVMIGAAAFVIYVRILESRSVFFPLAGESGQNPSSIGLDYEDVFFKTADGVRLHGWFIPAEGSGHGRRVPALLVLHGNAGNIAGRLEKISILSELGISVFIIDYRGYGLSEGRPSEKGIYLDAQAAFDYLLTRDDVRHDRIFAVGVSLGGAVAADLALERPVRGLVMQSTFTSAKDMAKRIFPLAPSFLVKTQMDSLEKISRVKVPVCVIHSSDDEMIPFEMGKRLFEAARGPRSFLELRGGHNEAHLFHRDMYLKGLREFLQPYL